MENTLIFIGIGGLVWIFMDIMKRGKKPETSPPVKDPPALPPDFDFQKFFRSAPAGTGSQGGSLSEIREINRIARMYDAMRQPGTPAFFDLSDAQIMAVIQRYKGGAA